MARRGVGNWLRDTFLENWPVKLLSVIVATILWFHVLGAEDPQSTQAVTVQVVPVNEPEGLKAISITPDTLELRLRGRESALAQAQIGRIRVEANLRNATVATNQVPLRVAGVPLSLAVVPGYPTTARVELDKIIERERPVHDIVRGEPARGFVIDEVVVEPDEVTVRGATTLVREVARAVVVVDVSGINQSAPFEVEVEARDNRNVVVSDVTFEPATVTVTVTVRELNVRYVPVRPVLGSPPSGYSVAGVRTDPQIVTVTSEDDISRVQSVPTLPVDISGLRGSKQYAVSLNVPPGLRVEGPASVQVTVTTQPTGGASPAPPDPAPGAPAEPGDDVEEGEDNGARPENLDTERPVDEEARENGAAEDGEGSPAAEQSNSTIAPRPGDGNGS